MRRDGRPVDHRCLGDRSQPRGQLPLPVRGAQDLGAHAHNLNRLLGQDVVDHLIAVGVEEGSLAIPVSPPPVRLHDAHEGDVLADKTQLLMP